MKKIVLLLFLIHLLPSLSFAQETIKPIKIAVKEFPPFVFKELKGFSIDMARHICTRNGLKPEFIYYDSVKDVLEAVQSGACDINFSGTTITAEREKYVDFSHPFFDSGLIVAVRTNPDNRLLELTLTIPKASPPTTNAESWMLTGGLWLP